MQSWADTDTLNRYLRRIDGAILAGRYTLAYKLAYRCLKAYYKAFIQSNMPEEYQRTSVDLMSVSICRYLYRYYKTKGLPYSDKTILFIALFSSRLSLMNMDLKNPSGSSGIDRAVATYARDSVDRIVRYLLGY